MYKKFLPLPFYNPFIEKLFMSADFSHIHQVTLFFEEITALDPISEVYDQILEFYITSKCLLDS